MKLRHKLLTVIGMCTLFLSVTSIAVFQLVLTSYIGVTYEGAATVLHLASQIVQQELIRARALTLRAATDGVLQRALQEQGSNATGYDRDIRHEEVRSVLRRYATEEPYISRIAFTGPDRILLSSDMPTRALPQAILAKIDSLPATQYSSEIVLPTLRGEDLWILLRVRRTGDYSLTSMGIMAVAVNLERLAKIYGRVPFQAETHLKIYADESVVYETPDAPQLADVPRSMPSSTGSFVQEVRNTQYLMAYTRSPSPQMCYLYMVPVRSVLSGVGIGGVILVLTMLCLAAIAIAAGYWIAGKITAPIEQLRVQLDRIGEGKFEPIALEDRKWAGDDEIGAFYRDFQIMVGKINTLLNENYARQIESQKARLHALEAQISPHFLYNTLDSISWLAISGQTDHVSTMARSLGNLLRATLSQTGNETTLAEELERLGDYIAIQSLRFGDRLRFSCRVPAHLLAVRIPSLILQPLVENSIHYGVEKKRNGCTIEVTAQTVADQVQVSVHDDGIGMTEELQRSIINGTVKTSSTGVGIANIQKRLHILYGKAAWLRFESAPSRGTTARIRLPLTTSQRRALVAESPEPT